MNDPIRFETTVAVDDSAPDGYMRHHLVIPPAVAHRFPGVERLRGSIEGTPFSRAVVATADGELRLRFGKDWLRSAALSPGDVVCVELDRDQDPHRVDVPDELSLLFDADPEVEHLWEDLTPGRQRSLVYGVERAKRPETRRRRAEAIVEDLLDEFGLRRI